MAVRLFGVPGHVLALQALSLTVSVVVGVSVVSKRVGAAEHDRSVRAGLQRRAADRLGQRVFRGAQTARVGPAAGAVVDAGAQAAQGVDAGLSADRGGDASVAARGSADAAPAARETASLAPSDYTVEQTEDDIPSGLSDEQRRSFGTGPVPIHREGRYRSALAHPRFGPAANVRVGVVLNSVRGFDIRTGMFQADLFVSLMSDRPMPDLHLTFTNGNISSSYALIAAPTLKVWRFVVDLHSPVDLRAYPFDTQELVIEIEDQRAGVDQVVFVADPDRTALDEGFDVAGWGVAYLGARAYRHAYPRRFDRDDLYVSRYKITLGVDRFSTSAAFSVFVPAFIIILISLTGLWMPAGRIDVRSATGAPMLAAAVLFHFSLMQALPATGYLTRADKLMLGVYMSLLLNMLSTWLFFVVREKQHDVVFRLGRLFVPPITVVIMALASWI